MTEIEEKEYINKDYVRSKTLAYFKKYCDLERKCQICGEKAEIHHPDYKNYLKINFLCRKHHMDLHKFRISQPPIIDLEKSPKKKQCKNGVDILVKKVNSDSKRKAMFVLKCKGKDLSTGVREYINKLAEEFDKIKK